MNRTNTFVLLVLIPGMCVAKAPAFSSETTYALEVLPADHSVRIDPETGTALTFLTTKTPSSSLYFHERSWLPNGSMIIFLGHRGLTGYLTATGELVELKTGRGRVDGATVASRRNSIFCMRGTDVLELTPTIKISSNPTATASRVHLTERTIATLHSSGQLNGNYDDRYLALGLGGDVPSITIVDVNDGTLREVCRIEAPLERYTHVQWSRSASNLLSFAGGDDWHHGDALDRIWVVDPVEGVPRPAHSQIEGELVTHESWWVNDQILFCGAPPPIGFQGEPEKRELSHVNILDPKMGNVRIIGAGSWWPGGTDAEIWKRNWWHCAGSDDGRWIVADTPHGDVVLFEGATTRSRLLTVGHRTYGAGKHLEPGWDRKGEQVIFSSNMLSDKVNACIATIPKMWQTENPMPRVGVK